MSSDTSPTNTRKRRNDIRPSAKVVKCLFGKCEDIENDETKLKAEEENISHLKEMEKKYGYDFIEDRFSDIGDSPCKIMKIIEARYGHNLKPATSSNFITNSETLSVPSENVFDKKDCSSSREYSVNEMTEKTEETVQHCSSRSNEIDQKK